MKRNEIELLIFSDLKTCYKAVAGTSLVAKRVKNLPAMQRSRFDPPDQEDYLRKKMATHFSILAWRTPWTEVPWGRKESDTTKQLTLPLS